MSQTGSPPLMLSKSLDENVAVEAEIVCLDVLVGLSQGIIVTVSSVC